MRRALRKLAVPAGAVAVVAWSGPDASARTSGATAALWSLPPCSSNALRATDALDHELLAEHRTGNVFALLREPIPNLTTSAHLLGCNTRCMLGWCRLPVARAYTFGLYCNGAALLAAARRAVSTGTAGAPESAEAVTGLLDECAALHTAASSLPANVSGEQEEISLVLVMSRDINGAHLAHGFRNSILSRLPAVEARIGRAAGSAVSAGVPDAASLKAAALASGKANLERAGSAASSGSSSSVATGVLPAGSASASAVPAEASGQPPEEGPLAQLSAFASAFNGIDFPVGSEIVFTWAPRAGRLITAVRLPPAAAAASSAAGASSSSASAPSAAAVAGSQTPLALPQLETRVLDAAALTSPLLARTLFEVYSGARAGADGKRAHAPVSWRAKDTFERNVAALTGAGSASPAAANAGTAAGAGSAGAIIERVEMAVLPAATATTKPKASSSTSGAASSAAGTAENDGFHIAGFMDKIRARLGSSGSSSSAAETPLSAAGSVVTVAHATQAAAAPGPVFTPCLAVRSDLLAAAVSREHSSRTK